MSAFAKCALIYSHIRVEPFAALQVPAAEIYAELEMAEAEGSSLEPVAMTHCNGDASLSQSSGESSAKQKHLRVNGGRGVSDRVLEKVSVCSSAYEACADAHAIIVCTEWHEFKVL